MDDLAQRAVACKGWRWMPGMLGWYAPVGSSGRRWSMEDGSARKVRVLRAGAIGVPLAVLMVTADGESWPRGGAVSDCLSGDLLPDLTDPATLGCLLALVRDAWGEPKTAVSWWGSSSGCAPGWDLTVGDIPILGIEADTEAEALVLALETAP